MTTSLKPGRLEGRAGDLGNRIVPGGRWPGRQAPPGPRALALAGPGRSGGPMTPTRWLARHPAWPLVALLAGYPLWWALGFGDFVFILAAIPMAARMNAWRAQSLRPVRTPPGFGLWLLFLVCMLAGAAALTLTAPGTIATPVGTRVLSFGVRAASYLAVTVLLLYAGNLTESELPRGRIAWLLGLLGLYTVMGGLGGVLAPHFSFSSPLQLMLPQSVQANPYIQAEMHPSLAQVQDVLGVALGRPDAPFPYTNTWGNCLALLLPWLVTAWWIRGTRRQRVIAAAALTLVIVPIVYSLNRGLWLALIFTGGYVSLRLAARGKLALLGMVCVGTAVAGMIIVTTPLQSLISQRLVHGQSNAHRASLSILATRDALSSPIIGYGDTRHQQGSVTSIAVGRTAKCKQCGQVSVGNNGQLWLLFICSGFVGAGLYLAFFAYGTWRFWRDTSPEGIAGVLVLLLTFIFMVAYDAVGAPLGITMLAYAVLWRNEQARREAAAPAFIGRLDGSDRP
jgi:hypothetical protein